jgi:5,10-methylenetetrahydromethanopterin reductase
MRYGVTLQGVDSPSEFSELVAWIESLGYDDLWLTDSSLHAGEVYVYLTLALQATTRLRVGSAVTNPLTRHPAITANAFATLEALAPGRVVCGIGVGDRPLPELGLKVAKVSTLTKTVDVLRRLWRGEKLDGREGLYEYSNAHLHRKPPGELPVHFSASGPKTLEAAGEHADGVILLAGLFPEGMEFALEAIGRGRARSTRPAFSRTCFLYGSLRDDEQTAIDEARTIAAWFPQTAPVYARLAGMSDELIADVIASYGGGEFQEAAAAASKIDDDLVRKIAFAGTPETAAPKLRWLHDLGVEAVSVFPLGADRRGTIERFASMRIDETNREPAGAPTA